MKDQSNRTHLIKAYDTGEKGVGMYLTNGYGAK